MFWLFPVNWVWFQKTRKRLLTGLNTNTSARLWLGLVSLLLQLRQKLIGVSFPGCPVSFKMSAYANDLIVLVNSQKDIYVLIDTVTLFGFISSAKVNWGKSKAVMEAHPTYRARLWKKVGWGTWRFSWSMRPRQRRTGTMSLEQWKACLISGGGCSPKCLSDAEPWLPTT